MVFLENPMKPVQFLLGEVMWLVDTHEFALEVTRDTQWDLTKRVSVNGRQLQMIHHEADKL